MTPIETIAFATLWLVLLCLAGLVLILYRQVEKAYQRSAAVANPLPPGTQAPPIDVLADGGGRELELPADGLTLLVFVTTTCPACEDLLHRLTLVRESLPGRTVVLVTGEGFEEFFARSTSELSVLGVAHPADVSDGYRVSMVPMLYLLDGRTVLGASTDGSTEGLESLLATANSVSPTADSGAVTRGGGNGPVARPLDGVGR